MLPAAEYTEEKISELVRNVLKLQQSVEGHNFGAYDAGLETLAAVTKATATAARQVAFCTMHSCVTSGQMRCS